MTAVLLIGGLAVLTLGAEALVRGASRLASAAGISPLVVGLTVVAFGTSSPELAVSVQSAVAGQADIALGNVVGSNIFNVLFILGLTSMITPLVVAQQLIRLDVPVMILVSMLAWLLAWDGAIGRVDGLLLVAGGIAYTAFLIVQSRRERNPAVTTEYAEAIGQAMPAMPIRVIRDLAFAIGGLVLLVAGARWFVAGAVDLARAFGFGELVIGLTIVAAGTSMPEVATSVVAALRGERDIAVGNVVGSCIFNLLIVLGAAAVAAPAPGVAVARGVLVADLPIMIAVAVACLPIFFTGHAILRWEGAVFFGYYLAYTAYLMLTASGHAALDDFRLVMAGFVLPLTAITIAVSSWRHWRISRPPARL